MSKIQDSTIVVVGGAGFVGSNLVRHLLELNAASVHIVDNLLSAERSNIPNDSRVCFTEGSIAEDDVLDQIEDTYDYVFHLATYHGNQSSIANPIADHDNNLLTTLKLFQRLKAFRKLRKIVYAGAGLAVAEKTYDKLHATSEDAPISIEMDSPYSISKIVGEFYAVYYHQRHKLPTVRARFQNVYGPREILGAGRWRGTPATVWRNVTPTFIYKSLHQQALPLEGGGEATRDFIYVGDLVRGLVSCGLSGKPGDVYNLASGAETSIHQLASQINGLTDNPTPPDILPRRTWDHSGRRFGDPTKARQMLRFEASTPLAEGLARTIAWTQESLPIIEGCIARHDAPMREYAGLAN